MLSKEPMFKIIPWKVRKFKNQQDRLLRIIEILKEIDEYDLEVDYERDSNNNENIVFWLMYNPKEMDEMFNELIGGELKK